jgi:excisionase family DNA binding protein
MTAPRPTYPTSVYRRPPLPHRSPLAQPQSVPPPVVFLTVAEVASQTRVSKMTIYRLIHNGELPAKRVGRSFRVARPALDAYLATVDTVTGHGE